MNRTGYRILGSFLILSLSLSLPAARADNTDKADVIRRETAAARSASSVAVKSEEQKALENIGAISFQTILQHPDDLALNFRFAQEQVANNDLLGASATLERILMIDPSLSEVRLFYLVVLYRLDNTAEAEREVKILEKEPLPSKLRGELDYYKRQIKLRKKKTQITIRQTTGIEGDTNRNSAPSSKEVLFADSVLSLSGTNLRHSDASLLNITSFDITHDLGTQAGHQLIGSFTYFLQAQNRVKSLDLSSYQFDLGPAFKSRWVNFTPTFVMSQTYLSEEHYQRTYGGNFQFEKPFRDHFDWVTNLFLENQSYLPIEENISSRDLNGFDTVLSNSLSYMLTPSMRIGTGFDYENKNAKRNFEDYDRIVTHLFHAWLLSRGQFIINALDFEEYYYDKADAAIAGRKRQDQIVRYRVTYGVPLGTLMGKLAPSFIADITVTFTYEAYRARSNITNYSYTNNRFQGMLTKRLEF